MSELPFDLGRRGFRILISVSMIVALNLAVTHSASGNDIARALEESNIKLHYEKFMARYHSLGKDSSNFDLAERLTHFLGRTVEIFEHNMLFLKNQVSYHLERNQFADMRYEELVKMALKVDDFGPDGYNSHAEQSIDSSKQSILDFKRDPLNGTTGGIERFVDFLGTKVGKTVMDEVVMLKEAFKSEYSENEHRKLEPFNPIEAIRDNLVKLRAPINSMMASARDAFWNYLKDEGIVVDVERQVKQRAAEIKRIRMRIDWRITGCISEPRQQSLCNSCYAISVVNLIEYFYCRVSGNLKRFSPQYIVDCGQSHGMRGCKGGKLTKVGQFVQNNGIQLESDFPYTGQEGQCKVEKGGQSQIRPHFKHWQYIHETMSPNQWLKYAQKGPLLVGIGMPADFFAYGGGIHDGHNCNPKMVHAMLLVGYGTQDDKEFWLLQNSFSKDWGENGYFRLSKDAPLECINSVIAARPEFNSSSAEKNII